MLFRFTVCETKKKIKKNYSILSLELATRHSVSHPISSLPERLLFLFPHCLLLKRQ